MLEQPAPGLDHSLPGQQSEGSTSAAPVSRSCLTIHPSRQPCPGDPSTVRIHFEVAEKVLEHLLIPTSGLPASLLEPTLQGRTPVHTEQALPESACQQAQHECPLLVVLLAAAEEQLLQQGDVLQQKATGSVMWNAAPASLPGTRYAAACMTSRQERMLRPTALAGRRDAAA